MVVCASYETKIRRNERFICYIFRADRKHAVLGNYRNAFHEQDSADKFLRVFHIVYGAFLKALARFFVPRILNMSLLHENLKVPDFEWQAISFGLRKKDFAFIEYHSVCF